MRLCIISFLHLVWINLVLSCLKVSLLLPEGYVCPLGSGYPDPGKTKPDPSLERHQVYYPNQPHDATECYINQELFMSWKLVTSTNLWGHSRKKNSWMSKVLHLDLEVTAWGVIPHMVRTVMKDLMCFSLRSLTHLRSCIQDFSCHVLLEKLHSSFFFFKF